MATTSQEQPAISERQSHDTLVDQNIQVPNMAQNLTTIPSLDTSHGKTSGDWQQDLNSASTARGDLEKDAENAGSVPKGPLQQEEDPNIVTFTGPDDPENPQNWSKGRRWFYTGILALMTWVVTFSSSVFSTGTRPVSAEFDVGTEVATLGTSLFVFGFGIGPMIWGPLSELYGRMPPLFFAFSIFAIFQIPVAVAQNIETIMLCRFFGGFFGVAPLAIIGGALADIWGNVDRGIAIALFAAATFVGPIAGVFVSVSLCRSHNQWLSHTHPLACSHALAFILMLMLSYSVPLSHSLLPLTCQSSCR
jgi:Major Facilitator Superfamily